MVDRWKDEWRRLVAAMLGAGLTSVLGVLAALAVAGSTAPNTAAAATAATTSSGLTCPDEDPTNDSSFCNVTIPYTGTIATYTVPDGMSSMGVSAVGGGTGNSVAGALSVTPGEVITIQSGGTGAAGNSLTGAGGAGGYGGGGAGGNSSTEPTDPPDQQAGGQGGGGATSVWVGSTLLFVAGGGGGGDSSWDLQDESGSCCSGANGINGSANGTGGNNGDISIVGGGGTTTGPGPAGADTNAGAAFVTNGAAGAGPAGPGHPGVGGIGASGDFVAQNASPNPTGWYGALGAGGGGGGGYYAGGGGGCSDDQANDDGSGTVTCGGGGEGSSYVAPGIADPTYGSQAGWVEQPGNGEVRLDWTTCGIAPALASSASRRGHSTSSPCNLNVTFTPTPMLSGMGRDGDTGAAFIGESSESCQSGCEKVTVTVTNHQNQPMANATVTASVTPITAGLAPYPSSASPSGGYLCSAAAPTQCGSGAEIDGLKTNGSGQVSLLYWAPGVTATETAQITVKATAANTCETACSATQLTGENTMPVTVKAHTLDQANMDLPDALVEALLDWRDGVSWTDIFKDKAKDVGFEALVKKAAEYFTEEDELVEKIGDGASSTLTAITTLIDLQRAEQLQDIFLAGFKISPTGLGHAGDEHAVSLWPGAPFEIAMSKKGNVLGLGGTSLLWNLADKESVSKDLHWSLKHQTAHLNVFEVSYCTQGKQCGPGDNQPGIQSYLDFEMTVGTRQHTILPYTQIAFPYNARAWFLTQFFKR